MSTKISISTPRVGGGAVLFPERCACCGAPQEAESTLSIYRLVTVGKRSRQEQVKHSWQVPHCLRCARSTRSISTVALTSFCLGFVLFGIVAFIGVTYGAWLLRLDEYGQPNNSNSLLVGAFAGLVSGLLGGLVFELLARIVLLPWYGRGLLSAPLFAVQVLNDSEYVAGLAAKPNRDATQVQFVFDNASIADEFKRLNDPRIDAN